MCAPECSEVFKLTRANACLSSQWTSLLLVQNHLLKSIRISPSLSHCCRGSNSGAPDDVVICCAIRTPLTKAKRGGPSSFGIFCTDVLLCNAASSSLLTLHHPINRRHRQRVWCCLKTEPNCSETQRVFQLSLSFVMVSSSDCLSVFVFVFVFVIASLSFSFSLSLSLCVCVCACVCVCVCLYWYLFVFVFVL